MKRLFLLVLPLFLFLFPLARPSHASSGFTENMANSISIGITGFEGECGDIAASAPQNLVKYLSGSCDENGVKTGLLPEAGKVVALLYDNQISSNEYIADILDNIGVPSVSSAYAQQTGGAGYSAMKPFLEFWKVFRNLAYSLYIIMFIVIGIMIMLRTKVNAQTIITIQSALPNLLITLILITFSYAIVGFMIDLMYFLIYFAVFLVSTSGIISDPNKLIDRFMSYSAWSVIFAGRNSIISAVSLSLREVLYGLGTGAIGAAGAAIGFLSGATPFGYLIVAVAFLIAMLKLMWTLITSYIMIIVQTITAPIQILFNAMPGSKAFGNWLKKTASYLIPFPVAACMFIFAAILVGNPADKTVLGRIQTTIGAAPSQDDNPFGVDKSAAIYQEKGIWMPPFTLTDSEIANTDILTIIGFIIFLMTPAAVKMAQDWLQVKESPYAAEALKGFGGVATTAVGYPAGWIKQARSLREQRAMQEYGARKYAEEAAKLQKERQTPSGSAKG